MRLNQRHLKVVILFLPLLFLALFLPVNGAPNFASSNFRQLWEYTDKLVDEVPGAGRGYTWGPVSIGTYKEEYLEGANGRRIVQYFDKSRMELSSDGTYVTSGLLTRELVTGQRQEGNTKFVQLQPSTVQVAGDDNSGGGNRVSPTYASFKGVVTFNPGENTASDQTGNLVNRTINQAGQVTTLYNPPANIQIGYYEPALGHNVPEVFQDFQTLSGKVWNGSAYVPGRVYTNNPVANVFGFPISEAYWIKAEVGGQEKDVLVQLFERRVLTYTPSNPVEFRVEMANIGRHYYLWRYTNAATEGITLDVDGTRVTIKPGGGQKFEPRSEVTVTIWSNQTKSNGTHLASIFKDFQTANPKIKVVIDNFNDTASYTEILKRLTQATATGALPNIATGYENWVPAFVEARQSLGLNKFISGPYGLSQKDLEDFRPNMLSRGIFPQYDNETYSWVFSNSGPVLYYNEDILKEYGLKVPDENYTWDQFVSDSKTVTEKSGGKTVGYIFSTRSVSELIAMPIYTRGGQIYNYGAGEFNFNDRPLLDQLNMLYEGVKGGYFQTADAAAPNDNRNKFINQQSVFYISSTANRSILADYIEVSPFNWNATTPPHIDGTKPVTTLYGGAVLGFKGKSDDEDLATWEVMKFMGSAAFQARWASATGYVPATKSTLNDPLYQAFLAAAPQNKIPLIVYNYATVTEPKLGEWQAVRDIVDGEVDALFQGKGTPADAARIINTKANAALKK